MVYDKISDLKIAVFSQKSSGWDKSFWEKILNLNLVYIWSLQGRNWIHNTNHLNKYKPKLPIFKYFVCDSEYNVKMQLDTQCIDYIYIHLYVRLYRYYYYSKLNWLIIFSDNYVNTNSLTMTTLSLMQRFSELNISDQVKSTWLGVRHMFKL